MLNWTGGNVRLKRPIVIDVTSSMVGPGVDLNGAKVIADFNDATRRAITIRIPGSSKNVALRGMKFFNALAQMRPDVRSGHTLLTQLVISGEVQVGLTVYSSSVEAARRSSAPIDWRPVQPVIAQPLGKHVGHGFVIIDYQDAGKFSHRSDPLLPAC